MKKLWLLALLLQPGVLAAQTMDPNSDAAGAGLADRTQTPSNARYEVFRTFALPSLALKLDKYDGVVYELVTNRGYMKSKDDTYAWQKTRRTDHPQDTGKVPGQVNYQIVASRVGPLLINIQTGATWLLSRDPAKDEAYWWPIQPQSGVVVPGE
jgi:hypothetical protein